MICVFDKQSLSPCHCDLQTPTRQSLWKNVGSPSSEVTGLDCEFPCYGSPATPWLALPGPPFSKVFSKVFPKKKLLYWFCVRTLRITPAPFSRALGFNPTPLRRPFPASTSAPHYETSPLYSS